MAINLSLQQKMSQQLVMTPQLQQAIKLLQLSHLELGEVLRQEFEENPTLEDATSPDEPMLPSDVDGKEGAASAELSPGDNDGMMGLGAQKSDAPDGESTSIAGDLEKVMEAGATPEPSSKELEKDIDWEAYLESYSYSLPASAGAAGPGADLPPIESTLSKPTSLIEHLRWQAHMQGFTETELQVMLLLIEEVNEDGYLAADAVQEVLEELEEYEITQDLVENMVRELQEFDPMGVGSRNLQECLLKQALAESAFDPIALQVIEHHLPEIEKRQFKQIARKLKVSLQQIGEAVEAITHLEPRPGRVYSDRAPQYITPDIYVVKVNDEWQISQNEDGLPKLRVSHYYRNALNQAGGDAKAYIQDKLRSAAWLIRSIQMRQRTIYKVTESILKFQADFFEKGPTHLKPLILKDVAEDVEMHESTISRVTTNKYMHTPRGIFELKYFFNSAINRVDGDTIASESVRNRIQELVSHENPRKPLSDQKLVTILKDYDINIARRTVAKYREMLNIPSSSKRKQVF